MKTGNLETTTVGPELKVSITTSGHPSEKLGNMKISLPAKNSGSSE